MSSNIMRHKFASWRDEPIIDTRLRTDIYKFIMQYFAIQQGVQDVPVVFGLTNRDTSLRLADVIPESFLREQLDHVKSLRMTPAHASFLQGMTVLDNGVRKFMFPDPSYSDHLINQTLSDYELEVRDGQFDLRFEGTWFGVKNAASPWEIPAMAIICESYVDWYLRGLLKRNEITHSEIETLFAAAQQRIVNECRIFRDAPGNPTFSQFGLRRAVSVQHERDAQAIIDDMIPTQCTGASDVQITYELGGNNPKGTVAHERDMIMATCLPDTDDWIREAPFYTAIKWAEVFPAPLCILLPDCHGTKQFYAHAPARIAHENPGTRIDSMETSDHDPLYLAFLKKHDADPKSKIVIPSDGQHAEKFVAEHQRYAHQYRVFSGGIGGAFTNNIKGLAGPEFRTPNLVIKAQYANGRPCTKVADAPNGGKVTGPDREHNLRVIRATSDEGWATHSGSLAI